MWPYFRKMGWVVVLGGFLLSSPVFAQKNSSPEESFKKDPVDISAEQGLEWHQQDQTYIAKGNVVAKQKDNILFTDVLTAWYRHKGQAGGGIWRLGANGRVRIVTPEQKVFADEGVYDLDQQRITLKGNNLRLESGADVVTAKDTLEYWRNEDKAVAHGNAVATRGQNKLGADVLTAFFKESKTGERILERVTGQGNVWVVTPTDVLHSERGVYNVVTQKALLTGNVRLTRGENQLNGDAAEVNLKTGISRLLAAEGSGKQGNRVHGLFVPDRKPPSAGKGKNGGQ